MFLMGVFAKIFIYIEKMKLKIEPCLLKIGLNKPSFDTRLIIFGFRCRIISVKLLVFGFHILLDTNTNILITTKIRN